MQEGFRTTKPPYLNGNNFTYWRSKIQYNIMMDIEIWFITGEGFVAPNFKDRKLLESGKQNIKQKKKALSNGKAIVILQCG